MVYELDKSLRTVSCRSIFSGRSNCTRHLGRYYHGNHTCEYCCYTPLCNLDTAVEELAMDCTIKLRPPHYYLYLINKTSSAEAVLYRGRHHMHSFWSALMATAIGVLVIAAAAISPGGVAVRVSRSRQ